MALVSTSIPNLLNGVSQQPAPLRQLTQGEEQTNALSSVIDGLIKRPPTEHLAELLDQSLSTAAIHVVETKVGVHIMVASTASSAEGTGQNLVELRIFDEDGELVSIENDADNVYYPGYLNCANPANDLKFLTVGADTYILNTTIAVTRSFLADGSPVLDSTHYNTFSDLPDGITGDGGTGEAVVDRHYKILNGSSTTSGEFFVKALSTSTYEESYDPTTYQLPANGQNRRKAFGPNPATMPRLLRLGDDGNGNPEYSEFSISWGVRTVGDLESAPSPSFLSNSDDVTTHKRLNNIFFYKNRLGFLCEDNVIFSGAGDFYNFFPKTVRTVLDDGPIDVRVAHTRANELKQAVTFNDSLTLFSDHTQFIIENAGALTPRTISIVASTEYENDSEVKPVGAGKHLYFPSKKGEFSSIREYAVEADTLVSAAQEITAHVPKYIPKNIVKLATSSNEDILACLSSEDRSKLYIYKWYTDGPDKLQSSWSTWQFSLSDSILDVTIVESTMYIVTSRTGQTVVEKIDLQYLEDTGISYCVRADRKVTLTGSYVTETNTTVWTLPYTHTGDVVCVKGGSWPSGKGTNILATMTNAGATTVTADGNLTAYPCILGIPYTMTYTFSHQYVKDRNGTSSIQSGRLQMRTMNVNFENTGNFKINVTPVTRPTYSYEYRGVTLNQAGSIIGEVVLNDGTFRFPLQSRNDRLTVQISADTFLPCSFQSAEWEGFFNIRSKRI